MVLLIWKFSDCIGNIDQAKPPGHSFSLHFVVHRKVYSFDLMSSTAVTGSNVNVSRRLP